MSRPEMPDDLLIGCDYRDVDNIEFSNASDGQLCIKCTTDCGGDNEEEAAVLLNRERIPNLILWLHQWYLASEPEHDEGGE